jgi:hypothetical protein
MLTPPGGRDSIDWSDGARPAQLRFAPDGDAAAVDREDDTVHVGGIVGSEVGGRRTWAVWRADARHRGLAAPIAVLDAHP